MLTTEALTRHLGSVLVDLGHAPGSFEVTSRQENLQRHTYWSENVTVRLASGEELSLFCKYHDGSSPRDLGHGHRGGLRYEAEVYRRVLDGVDISLPKFIGASADPKSGETLLVLERLENAKKVTRAPSWTARMTDAARWLARFHEAGNRVIGEGSCDWLITYDGEYYLGWSERARILLSPYASQFPWFPDVCDVFESSVESLLRWDPCVIHGKFAAKEVLVQDETIYPVDWESAAWAPGLVDLAMFVDGWDERAEEWLAEYRAQRWPGARTPADFHTALDVARLYVHMRWLGDFAELTNKYVENPWRLDAARKLAARLGAMP